MDEIIEQEYFVETDESVNIMVKAKVPKNERRNIAVLLIHGSGVGWIYWDIPIRDYSIMEYLAMRGLDVYALECRGYGKSTKPNGVEVKASNIARDIKVIIEKIKVDSGVKKVALAGHSSGGTIALVAASMYEELIDSIALIGTPYKELNEHFMKYAHDVIANSKKPGSDYVQNMHHKDIENRIDSYDDDVVVWYKKVVEENYSPMPSGIFQDLVNNPALTSIPTQKIPAIIINGSNEYVVEFGDSLALFKDLGSLDKSFIILPDGFHLPFIEKNGHLRLQESLFYWLSKK